MIKDSNRKFWETGDHPVLGFYLPGSSSTPNKKSFFRKKKKINSKSNWYERSR